PRKTAITLSATHLSLAHGTNHQLKKQKFEKLSQQSERPATWATLIMKGPGLRLLHGIWGIILCVQRSWQRILFVRGSKTQRSSPCLLRDRRLFQTRGPQDTFPLPNSGLGARSSFGQKTEPVLRRSRQYIRLDSLNPDLRCAKHRYWVTTYRFRPLHFHSPREG